MSDNWAPDARPKCMRSWSADSYTWTRKRRTGSGRVGSGESVGDSEGDGLTEELMSRSSSCPRRRRDRNRSCSTLGDVQPESPCRKGMTRRSLRQKFQDAVGQCFPVRTQHHQDAGSSRPFSVLLWSKRKIHVSELMQDKQHFSRAERGRTHCWRLTAKHPRAQRLSSGDPSSPTPVISWEEIGCPETPRSIEGWPSSCPHPDYVLVPDLLQIHNSPCYWGVLDRHQAELLLEGQPEGTFLLRDSAQDEFLFSVSFRRYSRSLHARIEQSGKRFSFDGRDPGVYRDPSVTGLLKHYSDPSTCLFFEPLLSRPLARTFPFSLQHLCRAVICSCTTYQGIQELPLPHSLREYLRLYHYRCNGACAV